MKLVERIRQFFADWRENARTKIVDTSHLRKMPERGPLHWVYTLLYAVAMVAVLWQHCHPFITILILAMILPLSIPAYIPYAKFGFSGRFILQLCIVIFALTWTFYRIKTGITVDKTAVELIGVAATTFLMGRRNRDYGYLFLISLFLMIYGALLPRILYLLLLSGAVVLILAILYCKRPVNLSGDPDIRMPEFRFRQTWFFYLCHLSLAAVLFFAVFSLIPTRPTRTKGAFEVSFLTDKDAFTPPSMQKWLRGDNIKMDPKAPVYIRHSTKPDTLDNSGKPMNVTNSKSSAKTEGDGSESTQGENLVFSVKMPLKLYHLVQLYDVYSGTAWSVSHQLKNGALRNFPKQLRLPTFHDVEANYTIQKWISPKLPSPFRPVMFNSSENAETVRIFQNTFFNAELYGRQYPRLPFKYKVSSRIFLPLDQQRIPPNDKRKTVYWIERTPARHYLQLPRKKISKRVTDLVKEITRNVQTPYEKAIALRDYLRNNYNYKLNAEKPPANRELTDFFLFELKEGHCEYFATTLAVMARLAGLPARIATGFSPGNYNTLTNAFDVYEYHAHAWTQIFFDDKGWLTFDATPPQNIISRTTPLGIGMLRDPFGDEWKISPPELTQATITYLKQAILESEKEKKEEISKVDELIAAALNKDSLKEKEAVKKKPGKTEKKPENWIGKTNDLLKKINNAIGDSIASIREYLANNWQLTLPLVIVLLSLLITLKMGIVQLRQRNLLKRALQYLVQASNPKTDNAQRIRCMYWCVRLLLKRANLPRIKNQELLAYAESLKHTDEELAQDTLFLFGQFYMVEYGDYHPDLFETENALNRTNDIKDAVFRIIRAPKQQHESAGRQTAAAEFPRKPV